MTSEIKWLLYAFLAFASVGFVQLFVFAAATDSFFAWTIQPPLTAAFLGAGFGAGCVLVYLSLRLASWAAIRPGVWTIVAFVAMMSLTTALHLDRLHLGADALSARIAAWGWLVVYAGTLVAGIPILARQARPDTDPSPVRFPLWLRIVLWIPGIAFLAAASWLFIRPGEASWWPWQPVTPLAGRAMASWLLPIGAAAIGVATRGNLRRTFPLLAAYATFAALQGAALVRYRELVTWGSTYTLVYLAMLMMAFAAGVGGLAQGRTVGRALPG